MEPGTVVHFIGKHRRYVVISRNQFGRLMLCALSGGDFGCLPSGVPSSSVEEDQDQSRIASGVNVAHLERNYRQYRAIAQSWGDPVDVRATL